MKAYKAWVDYGEGSTIVFAETRNQSILSSVISVIGAGKRSCSSEERKEHGTGGLTMAEYIEREAIKYEQWLVGPLCQPIMVVRKKTIDSITAADVYPVRHGRWIAIKVPNEWDKGQCSECRSIFNSSVWGTNYCPNCGAKMDLEAEYDDQ